MIYFTADEHYGHVKILKYCDRPFDSVEEMDEVMIGRHNSVVGQNDTTIHLGDFCLAKGNREKIHKEYITKLNGKHVFLEGSHDYWAKGWNLRQIHKQVINKQQIICCHYAMRVWPASHYNSWHLYGHSHGRLDGVGKSFDVGVDCFDFYPVSFDQVEVIMRGLPDNPGLVTKADRL